MKYIQVFCVLLFCSCEPSTTTPTPQQTGEFQLSFAEDIPRYISVYGLTPNKRPLTPIQKSFDERRREFYKLPSSAQHDTVRYVLESLPANADTLTLTYKRVLVHDKEQSVIMSQIAEARIVYALTTFTPDWVTLTETNILLKK